MSYRSYVRHTSLNYIIKKTFKYSWILFIFLIKMTFDGMRYTYRFLVWLNRYLDSQYKFKNTKYTYEKIEDLINHMTGRQFEVCCAELFKTQKQEYIDVELTQATCDGGKDIILTDRHGDRTYVECKRYGGDFIVGREILQKLMGATIPDNIEYALCITTGKYNSNAYEYASKVDNLTLWNMKDIMKIFKKLDENKIAKIMIKTFNSDNNGNVIELNKGLNPKEIY